MEMLVKIHRKYLNVARWRTVKSVEWNCSAQIQLCYIHCSAQNTALLLTMFYAVFCSASYTVLHSILLCCLHYSAQYSAQLLTLLCAALCSATYTALRSILLCHLHCSAQYFVVLLTLLCAVFCSTTYTVLRSSLLCYIHCSAHYSLWCLVAGWICVSNNCGSFYRAHCPALNDGWMQHWWSDSWQEKT